MSNPVSIPLFQRGVVHALCSLLLIVVLLSPAYAAGADNKPPLRFVKTPAVQQIRPRRPVKIKLHRGAKGEYQWDITGDNADAVVMADKRLRNLLQTGSGKAGAGK